jgi:indolepyruvate ferredoxin oxidoreductase
MLDPFRHSRCRRLERELIGWYEVIVIKLVAAVEAGVEVSRLLPVAATADRIRGFEAVKEASARAARSAAEGELARIEPARVEPDSPEGTLSP